MEKERCVEYYFDSRKYTKEEIIENIKIEQDGFENKKGKKANIDIKLNRYGIYVVKLTFENDKIKSIKNINQIFHNKYKERKRYKGYETYDGNNKLYGQYKATKIYRPI